MDSRKNLKKNFPQFFQIFAPKYKCHVTELLVQSTHYVQTFIDVSREEGPGFDSRTRLLPESFDGSLSSRMNADISISSRSLTAKLPQHEPVRF